MKFSNGGPRLSRLVPAALACPGCPCLRLPSDLLLTLAVETWSHKKSIWVCVVASSVAFIKATCGVHVFPILNFGRRTYLSKVGVLYDTFDIFCTFGAHWRSQWQYLVIWRFIFSERVVIFAAFVD